MDSDLQKKNKKKQPKEKPLSLYPLTLDETLTELLKVKPPPEGWQENKKKSKSKK
jgi:hypothetical protein